MSPAEQSAASTSLEERIAALPRVDALAADAADAADAAGPTGWMGGWTPRHTLVALAAFPALYLAYGSAVGTLLPGNALVLVSLVLAAVLGAIVAATYLPRNGAAPTTCAAGALLPVVLAMFLFEGSLATPVSAVLATVLVGAGLAQRIFGAGACTA